MSGLMYQESICSVHGLDQFSSLGWLQSCDYNYLNNGTVLEITIHTEIGF